MSDQLHAGKRDEVLTFWFQELTPKQWFVADSTVDDAIRTRFMDVYENLAGNVPEAWRSDSRGVLAAVIVLDQLPRNMFRGTPRMFATDDLALGLTANAISSGLDEGMTRVEKQFLYMPYQHSEDVTVQARSLELFAAFNAETLDFARRHKEIVDRFGRFPHRNKVLGRTSTAEEIEFLQQPGSSF